MEFFIDLVIVGLSLGMVYGLVALGISLVYSGLDIVHFAHGEIFMLGAFVGMTIANHFGFNYVVTILLGMAATGLIGVVIERLFYRRLTRSGGGYTFAGMGMIICGFGGAMFLMIADTLCRLLGEAFRLGELPVGVITAMVGGPFFIVLLRRRGRGGLT